MSITEKESERERKSIFVWEGVSLCVWVSERKRERERERDWVKNSVCVNVCMCEPLCEWERKGERESRCVCVCVCVYLWEWEREREGVRGGVLNLFLTYFRLASTKFIFATFKLSHFSRTNELVIFSFARKCFSFDLNSCASALRKQTEFLGHFLFLFYFHGRSHTHTHTHIYIYCHPQTLLYHNSSVWLDT